MTEITTDRTIIEPLSRSDFDALLEMYFEPDTNKFIQPLKDKSEAFYLSFLEKKLIANKEEVGFWVVKFKDTLEVLGTMNLNNFEPLSITHIGCHLKRKFWKQGFGKELFSRMIAFGFEKRKLKEIYAIVQSNHTVSLKLLKSLGLEEDRMEVVDGEELVILKIEI